MNRLIIILVIIAACVEYVWAGNQTRSVKLEIVLSEDLIRKNMTAQVVMYKDDLNSDFLSSTVVKTYQLAKGTVLALELPSKVAYVKLNLMADGKNFGPITATNNLFIFEEGDDLRLNVDAKKIVFKGLGSEKLNFLAVINQQVLGSIKPNENAVELFYKKDYIGYINDRVRQIDSMFNEIDRRWQELRTEVSAEVYGLIEVDNWARRHLKILSILISRKITYSDSGHEKDFANAFYKLLSGSVTPDFEERYLLKSYRYADYRYNRANWLTLILKNPELSTNNVYSMRDLYQTIKSSDHGIVGDKVILVAFNREFIRRPDTSNLLNEVLNAMNNSVFRNNLSEKLGNLVGKAFSFELPDANGKVYRMSDFKGKLVVLDFWFTGCHPCKWLAQAMKPIHNLYKDNPDIVFVTISIDGEKNKKTWIKSLDEETYTSKDGVNLLAVDGRNSAIIKHYGITSYPLVMIISKEGNIITTSPPRPSVDDITKNEAFINLINRYL